MEDASSPPQPPSDAQVRVDNEGPKESREEMLIRHRKEVRDLQSKDMAMKKAAAKGSKAEQKAKKRSVDDEISRLDASMKSRHAEEIASLENGADNAETTEPASSSSAVEEAEDEDGREPPGGAAPMAKKGASKVKEDLSSIVKAMAGVTTGIAGATEGRVSKAQKRRDKKMQQDADRERRILDEQQNGSVSLRLVEAQHLQEKLLPLGFGLHEIKPDGNCLYRAVAHQLGLRGGSPRYDFSGIRSLAANYMRSHPDDFIPFVTSEHAEDEDSVQTAKAGGRAGGEGALEAEAEDPSVKFHRYCQEVESSSAWGGQLELEALAHALKKHITVVSADLPDVNMGVQYSEGTSVLPLILSYHRHEYGLGEHYNSVIPLEALLGVEDS
eukprot:TRINITY_DN10248_c2_g2_i1.p1 TRINITY_DN10248_c2_g2~~TRINITY_DN10248_c2_g2_i1.p1  ORF type:complete len:407 (+),score=80.97 TRINITY_DN10248_c2_g2_i1:69-1223(+)